MIVRRLLGLVPVLLLVSFGVFMLSALVPGDAAVTLAGGESATPEGIERVRDQLGLDDPLLEQYGRWARNAVQLDFGRSLYAGDSGPSVWSEISYRIPVSLSIVAFGLLLGVLVGVPAGAIAGMRPGTLLDRILSVGVAGGIAVPNFFLALLLASVFAIQLRWFPAIGFTRLSEDPVEWLRSVTLPGVAIGMLAAASVARQTRAALIDVLQSNYVRTAWATGSGSLRVVGKHALKNAAIPAVTVLGLQIGALLGGSVLVEQIFSVPGLGSYLLRALTSSDIPVIQGVAVVFVLVHIAVNLAIDISYGLLNPKVRVS